ncbi:MAG TPA: tail fiber domain-containing protein, partial [Verrucomicrobiae bacterium]|nr:tail fiber domain-containing protein [Verrucomicrobiae bacterium]
SSTTNNEFSIRAQNGVRIQSNTGIHLDAADRPLIVRDWAPFDATAPAGKAGIGRWGLFMEPRYLTLGIPAVADRYFQVARYNADGTYTSLMSVGQAGNLHVMGNVYANGVLLTSDRNAKENFTPLNVQTVLAKVAALPISEWNYKTDSSAQEHIGPMAQDFHSAFGLNGKDDKHISVVDENGVALAAIQGLNGKVDSENAALQTELKRQNAENAKLKQEVENLKKLVNLLDRKVHGDEK